MSELGQAIAAGENRDDSERVDPLGGNEKMEQMNKQHRKESSYTPERIFKVVFVGDSGVGKTCFLHRFCHNRFRSTFSATIGVDFQVKSLKVEDRIVALQLWDTAGQERFRSITKQYFRKADGVLLMYDVSSELSFLNLRNWMQSVKDGVEQDCVLCLVGNKVDLCDNNEDFRVVKHKDGLKLAEEFNALFFETSASTGDGIHECMLAMSILLRDREDQHLEKALQLQMDVQQKKRKCCGRR